MNNDKLLEKIGKLIDEKLEPIKRDMATKADIKGLAEDMAELFHKTWEKLDETNMRVTIIEDHLGLPHPTETS